MAEIDEKTREALSQLAGEEYCGNCGFYHGSFEKPAGVIRQQLQQLADMKSALGFVFRRLDVDLSWSHAVRARIPDEVWRAYKFSDFTVSGELDAAALLLKVAADFSDGQATGG